MRKAIWVSRHEATPEQIVEIATSGFELVAADEGKRLGSMNLATDDDVVAWISALHDLIRLERAEIVYGVFAVPVQQMILDETCAICERQGAGYCTPSVPCFSAWNVQRSIEGQKPTFEHKKFVCVGLLYQ